MNHHGSYSNNTAGPSNWNSNRGPRAAASSTTVSSQDQSLEQNSWPPSSAFGEDSSGPMSRYPASASTFNIQGIDTLQGNGDWNRDVLAAPSVAHPDFLTAPRSFNQLQPVGNSQHQGNLPADNWNGLETPIPDPVNQLPYTRYRQESRNDSLPLLSADAAKNSVKDNWARTVSDDLTNLMAPPEENRAFHSGGHVDSPSLHKNKRKEGIDAASQPGASAKRRVKRDDLMASEPGVATTGRGSKRRPSWQWFPEYPSAQLGEDVGPFGYQRSAWHLKIQKWQGGSNLSLDRLQGRYDFVFLDDPYK
ncbi:hypothetical protein CVT24_006480 [Panaeolus cyanescens]|uniref:Uncharacterized protein n=1 Tax=Panaeolus cyanescens TaxID=181874 RepID=A0A409VZ81_9AGAR|nr:hypothetical protein CVT24_006480 [Panaeolus cyanescens]